MIYTKMTKLAMKIAYNEHLEQVDKSGLPYIFHPFTVAQQMTDEDSTVVALLHDVIEDTELTLDDLKNYGFNDNILSALKVLTHKKEVDYYEYIKQIATNEIAIKVKLADLAHNMDYTRLDEITEKYKQKYVKYKQSYDYLSSVLNEKTNKHVY